MNTCHQDLRSDNDRGALLSVPIYDITPFTMQDFPDKIACIIWLAGCNMRCDYCHNPAMIRNKGQYDIGSVFAFLKKRQDILDAVVLSGGEATLFPDIIKCAKKIKSMGYAIKLDTNGTRPDIIKTLIEKGYIDYIALDYKAPEYKYTDISHHKHFDHFHDTLKFLCQQDRVPFEIRTTVHTDLLNEQDIIHIIDDLDKQGYKAPYYVQNYHMTDDRQSLAKLPKQQRILDRTEITLKKKGFDLEFRNFT